MIFNEILPNIHWLPVVAVTIFSFLLGAAWHSRLMFGKWWKEEYQVFHDKKPLNLPLIFGGTGVAHFVALAGVSAVASNHGAFYGFISGLVISLVWVSPVLAGTYLFANRSLKILIIDLGMYLVLFPLAGFVLGIW